MINPMIKFCIEEGEEEIGDVVYIDSRDENGGYYTIDGDIKYLSEYDEHDRLIHYKDNKGCEYTYQYLEDMYIINIISRNYETSFYKMEKYNYYDQKLYSIDHDGYEEFYEYNEFRMLTHYENSNKFEITWEYNNDTVISKYKTSTGKIGYIHGVPNESHIALIINLYYLWQCTKNYLKDGDKI